MDNIIPLAGANPGDRIGPHVATRAIKVRQRQAISMLEVSQALLRIKELNDIDGPRDVISADLEKLAWYLRDSAY
ncbi:hypothetical protein [Sedimenticola selenatireducens]|uniref:Uncharacterized protein n=1 Tax=Sedimenticola selenatireducens TaxID=191960 RepID=A0A558DQZ1_9GAMM|nr:hypothetical protein [Sedimenticola selenatireducens]TVO73417.1 hypothetical protein FHP88_11030 [Sedimenticola selenatireducens]TVT63358.1 MAG: hypothetical protein FHK78_10960 [Sedimenticola selenatireducens]